MLTREEYLEAYKRTIFYVHQKEADLKLQNVNFIPNKKDKISCLKIIDEFYGQCIGYFDSIQKELPKDLCLNQLLALRKLSALTEDEESQRYHHRVTAFEEKLRKPKEESDSEQKRKRSLSDLNDTKVIDDLPIEPPPKKICQERKSAEIDNERIHQLAAFKKEKKALQDDLAKLGVEQKALGDDLNYCIDIFSQRSQVVLSFTPEYLPDSPMLDTEKKKEMQAQSAMPQPYLIQRIFEIRDKIFKLAEREDDLQKQIENIRNIIRELERNLSLGNYNPYANSFVQFAKASPVYPVAVSPEREPHPVLTPKNTI